MTEWISVKDRLPDSPESVLAYCEHDVYWVIGSEDLHIFGITHWQPLPDPPQDKEEPDA